MLRGMCVILQNMRNRVELNDLRGHVVSVQDDNCLCVELDRGGKVVLLRAVNVPQWESSTLRNVQTFEFVEGTSEEEIDAFVGDFCGKNYVGHDVELRAFLHPEKAQSSGLICEAHKCILLKAARLEHMGTLSRTAELLGREKTDPDAKVMVAYENNSLSLALPCTRDVYLHHVGVHTLYSGESKGER